MVAHRKLRLCVWEEKATLRHMHAHQRRRKTDRKEKLEIDDMENLSSSHEIDLVSQH